MSAAGPPPTVARQHSPARAVIRRLSRYDLHCLAVETPARPIHVGILAMLEGPALVDPSGRLRLAEIRAALERRVASVPELRRVVHDPGRLAGRAVWVDDAAFQIDHHVTEVGVGAPGDEPALFELVEHLVAGLLDRSRPLWRMWFLTGLADGRIGVLVVLHHALADGQAAMRMVRSLLAPPLPTDDAPTNGGPPATALASRPPSRPALVRDNVQGAVRSAGGLVRPATWRLTIEVARSLWRVRSLAAAAPVTSLNAPVGTRRRLLLVCLDLTLARQVARDRGCGTIDVVLGLVTGGVRALLAGRGEPVEQLRPRAGMAIALFTNDREHEAGNDIGTLHVSLPISEADPRRRLPRIAADRAAAGASPMVALEPVIRSWMRRLPGSRRAVEHQRMVNVTFTYLPGPPRAIEALGARVVELVPIAPLTGNLGLSFVALSYAGRLRIAVRADADRFPDLEVLVSAMEDDWRTLAAGRQADESDD